MVIFCSGLQLCCSSSTSLVEAEFEGYSLFGGLKTPKTKKRYIYGMSEMIDSKRQQYDSCLIGLEGFGIFRHSNTKTRYIW